MDTYSFWGIYVLLEMGRKEGKKDNVEKVSNKRESTGHGKVSLQAIVAKMCGMASMGCHEHHANNFIRGIELSFYESLMKWLPCWVCARGLSLPCDRVP